MGAQVSDQGVPIDDGAPDFGLKLQPVHAVLKKASPAFLVAFLFLETNAYNIAKKFLEKCCNKFLG